MKKLIGLTLVNIFLFAFANAQVAVKNLRCENMINPLGVDIAMPRFSWQLVSDEKNVLQTAYEIRVGSKPGSADTWSSGKQISAASIYVPYRGNPLGSANIYYWQVRIWDKKGKVSEWSEKAFWQMGLLRAADWKATWIGTPSSADSVNGPAILFRKEFQASGKIISATAFITTHGMYEAFINGKKIGNAFLTPGWTSYHKRLQYQAFDVTSLLRKGANAVGIDVGSGWYRTPLAWQNNRNIYGRKIGLLFQLEIKYSDGSMTTVVSDKNWKTSDVGPVRISEIYNGEVFDNRLEIKGWNESGFSGPNWNPVTEQIFDNNNLIATYNELVTQHKVFPAVHMFNTPKGEHVIDFGQNLVGWARIKINGKAGDSLIVDHAEVLDKNGNFYTENLRAAKARNIYVLNGKGDEFFEPHFTFQGFRYIRINAVGAQLKKENFSAVTLYSDMNPTGQFECSNPMLNQLQHNIQWGQKGNFLDVPTDCPQRDERLGWTGDAQAFSRTASFNMDVHNFFAKWLKDLTADQNSDGRVPFVVPNVLDSMAGGSAGWSDVSTIIPWNMWLAYGDRKILEDQYASMKAWVGFMKNHSKENLWNTGFHFGDWLFYRPADDNDGRSAVTDKYLIAQCFFAHSTQLLINAAKVLNRTEDVERYTELLSEIKSAFLKEYVTPTGRLVSGTQTAYVLSLEFDMLPESLRMQASQRLATNVKDYNNHLTTGFLGTPYLCDVLTRFGYDTIAYQLLLQETYPSWLYPVKMGATTIWERWDGEKSDSTFQTPGMNSFNHYAYGAIGDWMYRSICGVDTYDEGAGYKKIKIKPHTGGNLSYANADLQTAYGMLSAHWKIVEGKFVMDIAIPPNTTAVVYMPASSVASIQESDHPLGAERELSVIEKDGKYIPLQVGSGHYHFSSDLIK